MDMRFTTTHDLRATGVWRPVAALLVAVVLVAMLGATSAAAASPTACRVQNTITGKTYAALQPAVDAATKDDRLTVLGTCVGKSVIDKKLVIEGVRSSTSGKPTLSGAGKTGILVVRKAVRARVRGLEIVRALGTG
jgi:hypothetical protein